MKDCIEVGLVAANITLKRNLHADDRHVPGVYSILLDASVSQADRASAALDVFHSTCPVKNLDDFVFYAFDPATSEVLQETEEHEDYSLSGCGKDFERIADRIPFRYKVAVLALGDDGDVAKVGTATVVAPNKQKACEAARDLLWDDRLTKASCLADFRVTRIDPWA